MVIAVTGEANFVDILLLSCRWLAMWILQKVNEDVYQEVYFYFSLDAFLILIVPAPDVACSCFAVLVFLLPMRWLFTFLPFCRSCLSCCHSCCHSCRYCSCYYCHHFSSMLIWPAGCSFFGPMSTDRPEMDAHWSFVKGKERQTPTNAFPFFFSVFCFPSFLMSPCVLSGFLWFVAAGSDRGGGKSRAGLYKLRSGERMDEKEAWRDTGHISG